MGLSYRSGKGYFTLALHGVGGQDENTKYHVAEMSWIGQPERGTMEFRCVRSTVVKGTAECTRPSRGSSRFAFEENSEALVMPAPMR